MNYGCFLKKKRFAYFTINEMLDGQDQVSTSIWPVAGASLAISGHRKGMSSAERTVHEVVSLYGHLLLS